MNLCFSPDHYLYAVIDAMMQPLVIILTSGDNDGSAWGIVAAVALILFLLCVFYAILSRDK